MKEYNVYIDESGDEGINKGSKYFILTAVIVEKEKDLNLSYKIDEIKKMIEIEKTTQLHWNTIKGFPNKKGILDFISKEDFSIIHVVINTELIKYIKSKYLYYSFLGYLLERVSLNTIDGKINNIYISYRDGLNYKNIINKLSNQFNNIDFNKISRIKIMDNARIKLLQLADVCSSSFFQSLKYQSPTSDYYFNVLSNNFFKYKNKLLGYGIKLVPNGTKTDFKEVYRLLFL